MENAVQSTAGADLAANIVMMAANGHSGAAMESRLILSRLRPKFPRTDDADQSMVGTPAWAADMAIAAVNARTVAQTKTTAMPKLARKVSSPHFSNVDPYLHFQQEVANFLFSQQVTIENRLFFCQVGLFQRRGKLGYRVFDIKRLVLVVKLDGCC
ncbi:hypothetical protein NX059_011306 [Plenodomus lindquistii]|nr:hypothetical protein NX059_011306 [Plenodomus lindquistii]